MKSRYHWIIYSTALLLPLFLGLILNNIFRDRRRTLQHHEPIHCLVFSPDGNILASSGGGVVKLWDVKTQALLRTLVPDATVYAAAFSPDGTSITACVDSFVAEVELVTWDTNTGKQNARWSIPGTYSNAKDTVFSGDARLITSGVVTSRRPHSTTKLRVWDTRTRQARLTLPLPGHLAKAALSSDGKLAIAEEDTILLYNVNSGKLVHTLKNNPSYPVFVAFSADGMILASTKLDSEVELWSVPTGQLLKVLAGSTYFANSTAYHSTKTYASAGLDGAIRLWDLRTGKLQRTLTAHWFKAKAHAQGINSMTYSPDGTTLASGSQDGVIKLWSIS